MRSSNSLSLKSDAYATGFTEVFRTRSTSSEYGFNAIVGIELNANGSLAYSTPYFYFSESFVGVADAVRDLSLRSTGREGTDHLARYVNAKKPTHTLFKPGVLVCQVEACSTGESSIVGLQPLKGLSDLSGKVLRVGSIRLSEDFEASWNQLAMATLEAGVRTRYDFIKYRIHNG